MNDLTLICADCNDEWTLDEIPELDARDVGDGTICVSCPECDRDLAHFVP